MMSWPFTTYATGTLLLFSVPLAAASAVLASQVDGFWWVSPLPLLAFVLSFFRDPDRTAAGGEDDPLHYDLVHAKAQGFPGLFGLGMHQAGGLAAYATRWLGAHRVRSMRIRFPNMFFIGDELSYEGRVTGIEAIDGRRMASLDLQCTRKADEAAIVGATMQLDLGD